MRKYAAETNSNINGKELMFLDATAAQMMKAMQNEGTMQISITDSRFQANALSN